MKRILVWLTLVAMLFTAAPVASALPAPNYSKSDIMTAVSGMGRMPSSYYNLAGIGLNSMSVSPEQAETFTKKLYQVWAFLSQYAYIYNGNQSIKDVLTREQWTAITNYASKLAYDYDSPAFISLFTTFMSSSKAYKLAKPGVPRSLLGVKFDDATLGVSATVKVYTTADVIGEVYLTNAAGVKISTSTKTITYPGTLTTYKEHVLSVQYQYAGKNAVRIYGVDAAYPENYFSTMATVGGPATSGTTGSNSIASVKKVTAGTVELGTASMITVTTSAQATNVKITSKSGILLGSSNAPATTTPTKTFVVPYCFSGSGTQTIRVYAGTVSGDSVLWNKSYKTASVKVSPAASGATISKVTSGGVLRGQEATIRVYTSSKVTRVQLFDAGGDMVGFTRTYTVSGKLRVFTLHYRNNKVGSYKLSAQAGNDANWNSAKKTVTVKFSAPAVTSIKSTKVKKGTASTITVTGPSTATRARLYTSRTQYTEVDIANGKFTFSYTYSKSGKRTVYAQVFDGVVWGPRKAGSVTFLP